MGDLVPSKSADLFSTVTMGLSQPVIINDPSDQKCRLHTERRFYSKSVSHRRDRIHDNRRAKTVILGFGLLGFNARSNRQGHIKAVK